MSPDFRPTPRLHGPFSSPLGLVGAAFVAATLGLSASCAGTGDPEVRLERIEALTRSGDYDLAAQESVDLLDTIGTGSDYYEPAIEAQRTISLASGLELVRQRLLADNNDEALELLKTLDRDHPNNPAVAKWLDRANTKLGDVWFQRAREEQASEKFQVAAVSYRKVLEYVPNHPLAGPSLLDLDRVVAHRAELAVDYYNSGVRDFTNERLPQAAGNFGKVPKFDRDNSRAARRSVEVNRELSKARMAAADVLAGEDRYAAAAKEYTAAAVLNPESTEIQGKLDEMKVEAQAAELLSQGRFMVLRGQIERGEKTLNEGMALTKLQDERFDKALSEADEARSALAYQNALDKEHDFRYEAAIEGYSKILEQRDFYKDTRSRLDTLTDYVRDAGSLYQQASDADSDERKLELYQQIEVFWPEYKDVPDRIARLSRKTK